MALLYPRPGELRMADWSEFDFEKGIWTIPAARAKMRREHVKPLPAPALAILKDLKVMGSGRGLTFRAIHTSIRPISENTLNTSLRRMGFGPEEATSHGFRSSASSLLNESGLWSDDAIETELAHMVGNSARRAYNRTAYWDERVKMSEWWTSQVLSLV